VRVRSLWSLCIVAVDQTLRWEDEGACEERGKRN
jgi:hypothetical protein